MIVAYVKELKKEEYLNNHKLEKSFKEMETKIKNKFAKHLIKFLSKVHKTVYIKISMLYKYVFNIVTIKKISNGYVLIIPYELLKQEKNNKIIDKIKKNCIKFNIDTIVLSEKIESNMLFVERLDGSKVNGKELDIITGKGLFRYMIYDILKYILNNQNKDAGLEDIYFLIKGDKDIYLSNILYLANFFKTINIITKNVNKYKRLEQRIYEENGILFIVANNKKKSLKRAKYIVNFDFTREEIEEYNLNRMAIIINIDENVKFVTSGFNGININGFKIDINSEIKEYFKKHGIIMDFSIESLYESIINKKERFEDIVNKIKEDEVTILSLCGNNGDINTKEYVRVIESNNSEH